MIKLFLEGVYNHGEVIWLETKWLLLWLFRAYIHQHSLGEFEWVEIMPRYRMLRYCSIYTSNIFRYAPVVGVTVDRRELMLQIRGWKCKPDVLHADVVTAINKAHENIFYKDVDKILS